VPWRPTPQRQKAFDFAKRWWAYWGFEVVTADSNPDLPFSLAEARNNGVRKVEESCFGPGAMIICDADTVPDRQVVSEAVRICNKPGKVVYPYTRYRYLNSRFIDVCDEGLVDEPTHPLKSLVPQYISTTSVGGIVVAHSQTYWEVGGMDERFDRTWGFEDNAFVAAADTLAEVVRLDGDVYSFSHDVEGRGRDCSSRNPNYWRNQLYQHCYGKPKLMRELIKR